MNTELKPCPICGAKAAFKYGGKISNGMRLVKVGCSIGCVEQGIYHMTEEKAAMPWNGRIEQASQPHEIHNRALEKVGRIMESMKYADEDGRLFEWESGYNGAVKDLCAIVEKAKRN